MSNSKISFNQFMEKVVADLQTALSLDYLDFQIEESRPLDMPAVYLWWLDEGGEGDAHNSLSQVQIDVWVDRDDAELADKLKDQIKAALGFDDKNAYPSQHFIDSYDHERFETSPPATGKLQLERVGGWRPVRDDDTDVRHWALRLNISY